MATAEERELFGDIGSRDRARSRAFDENDDELGLMTLPPARPVDVDSILGEGDLDITSEDLNDLDFDEIDDEIARFSNDKVVKEALDRGVDLKSYGRQVENELREAEKLSIGEYMRESEGIAELHYRIKDCDNVLNSMETLLCGFQDHLGAISSEIKFLQEESKSLSIKVKNRKAVQDKLTEFVNEIVLPPPLIVLICDSPVDQHYLDSLILLNSKLHYIESQDQSIRAVKEVQPHLRKAKNKAVLKVSHWITEKIESLNKPKTNIQIIQQNVLLKFRYFQEFLNEASSEAAANVQNHYTRTVSKIYFNHFKTYLNDLERLLQDAGSRTDLLVPIEETGMTKLFSSKQAGHKDVFALGARAEIFNKMDTDSLVAHSTNTKYYMEFLYRSFIKLLVDTATPEYLFEMDFFGTTSMFNEVFAKTLQAAAEWVELWVTRTFDLVALLLVTRITNHYALIMQSRRVRLLDPFFDRIYQAVLPKTKVLIDANHKSLLDAKPKAIFNGKTSAHEVVRRYGSLAATFYAAGLNEDPEPILTRMRSAISNLIKSMADQNRTSKHRVVFLINQYDAILRTLNEARQTAPGPVGTPHGQGLPPENTDFEWSRFELESNISVFVEEELLDCNRRCFAKLISFIKEAEEVAQAGGDVARKFEGSIPEALVKDFASSWKAGMDAILADCKEAFPHDHGAAAAAAAAAASSSSGGLGAGTNKVSGDATTIFQKTITQLLLYYSRFETLLKNYYRNTTWSSLAVPLQTLMHRVREISGTDR